MDKLGCKTVADLQKVEIEDLNEASRGLGLRVMVERDGSYVPADPYEAYLNGAAKDVAILQGCNKDEMGYFVFGAGLKPYNAFAADRLKRSL